jgi:lambda repressor-like predicted transcriptional regulator
MDQSREQEIVEMHNGGLGLGAISEELGLSTTAIRNVLQKYGVSTRKIRATKDEDTIIEQYLEGGPIPEILTEHTITYGKLYSILARHGVPTRKVLNKEGRKLALDQAVEMYEKGYKIWKITEETGVHQPTLHQELHRRGVQLRRHFTPLVESGDKEVG